MPDSPEKDDQAQQQRAGEENKSDENKIDTCAGGLTEEQTKELQNELDRAKEESSSFSSNSYCSIS